MKAAKMKAWWRKHGYYLVCILISCVGLAYLALIDLNLFGFGSMSSVGAVVAAVPLWLVMLNIRGTVGKIDGRLDGIDRWLDGVDGRLSRIDGRLDRMDERLNTIEREVATLKIDVATLKGSAPAAGGASP